jgi:hypothetical protein
LDVALLSYNFQDLGFPVGVPNPSLMKMKLCLQQWMVSLKDWGLEDLKFRISFWILLCCSYSLQRTGVSRGRFLFSEDTMAACWYVQLRRVVKYN